MIHKNTLRWVAWALAAFFYFYEYLLRVSPSIMVPELMNAFHVDAAALGLLSSFYFYSYAPMQLPVGLLIDRFGAKKLLTFAACVCGIGAILFGIASRFWEAASGRFLLGFGSSFAFVAMVYVCSHWFPKSKRALLVGLANSIGMLGAFCGQGPLSSALHEINWRVALLLLGFLGFILSITIYWTLKKEEPATFIDSPSHALKDLFKGLVAICKSGPTWVNALIALFFYMTTTAVADLWGVPFLQSAYHLSKQTASFATSMIFIGWLAGGPVMGLISDRLKKRKVVVVWTIILTLLSLVSVVYITAIPLSLVYILLFSVGFFSSGELLNFTLATELNAPHIKGSAIAFTNCIVSFGSGLIQPIIGLFLDITWDGTKVDGINLYSVRDYQHAFFILPVLLCLALLLSSFLKEGKIKEHAVEPLSGD
ncbi:MAG: MFS transporter [Chlamydiae bacterium]|nr:MFS transporter [Chlamydiota bacterium]